MLSIINAELTFNPNTNLEKRLFNKFNVHFSEGEFVTVIGANGSGKSSLLNIISGNYKIESGNIFLKNKDISKDPEWKRAQYIGRVFQSPTMGLAPDLTLMENFAIALHKHDKRLLSSGITKKEKEIIRSELKALHVNLEDKLSNKPGELSGGQCQSAALIMAVLSNPLILLLDEHTAALDPQSAQTVLSLTQKLVYDKKLTTIMVTHNITNALQYGDRMNVSY